MRKHSNFRRWLIGSPAILTDGQRRSAEIRLGVFGVGIYFRAKLAIINNAKDYYEGTGIRFFFIPVPHLHGTGIRFHDWMKTKQLPPEPW